MALITSICCAYKFLRVHFFLSGELYNNLHQTRCPLLLVADYRFFNEMGGGSSKTTVNYLISLIDRSLFWNLPH